MTVHWRDPAAKGLGMFRLGRRKSQFTERYEKIGAGHRVGQSAAVEDAEVVADNAGAAEVAPTVSGNIGRENDVYNRQEQSPPESLEITPDRDLPSSDAIGGAADGLAEYILSAQNAPVSPDTVVPATPVAPRLRALGHDHQIVEAEQAPPGWLDTFDPGKPIPTPAPRAPAPSSPPYIGRRIVTAVPSDGAPSNSPDTRTRLIGKPIYQDGYQREPGEAPSAPAWLDTASPIEPVWTPVEQPVEEVAQDELSGNAPSSKPASLAPGVAQAASAVQSGDNRATHPTVSASTDSAVITQSGGQVGQPAASDASAVLPGYIVHSNPSHGGDTTGQESAGLQYQQAQLQAEVEIDEPLLPPLAF